MTSPVPFWRHVFQPNLIADANQFAKRPDVERSLPEQDLQFCTVGSFRVLSRLKQAVNDVGLVHSLLHERSIA